MNKSLLLLVCCLFAAQLNGQELFFGGGGLCTFESSYPSGFDSRPGLESSLEFKPTKLGLVVSVSPNILFDDEGILYSLPFEIKWLLGNKYKIYPSYGYVIRNRSFKGALIGVGIEYELNEKIKAGMKCYRVGGKYTPEHYRNLGNYNTPHILYQRSSLLS